MFSANQNQDFFWRNVCFGVFLALSSLASWKTFAALFQFSLSHDYASHILLIAPISAFLIYLKRDEIHSAANAGPKAGLFLFLIPASLYWLARTTFASSHDTVDLSLATLATVALWIVGFATCYGIRAFTIASFPLFFLLLLVPLPGIVIDKIIFFLQAGSAWLSYELFQLLSIPVFKDGFELRLPTLDLEVAKQCSGIRSSLALLISVLILGHFVLRSVWRKTVLAVSIVPILILKNALRIVTIALLSIYLDRRFLHGWLHTSGGIVFYVLGLLALIPIVTTLRKSEEKNSLESLPGSPADALKVGANEPSSSI